MDFKLKPCPFCGKEVETFHIRYEGSKVSELEVACEECNADIRIIIPERYYANGLLYIFGLDAVERWNRRLGQNTEEEDGRTSNYASN